MLLVRGIVRSWTQTMELKVKKLVRGLNIISNTNSGTSKLIYVSFICNGWQFIYIH
jgi:hypothetical protein